MLSKNTTCITQKRWAECIGGFERWSHNEFLLHSSDKTHAEWQRQQRQYQNRRQRWQLYRTTAHICQQWTADSWILWERQPQHRLRDWEFTVKLPSRRKFATVFLYVVQNLRCFLTTADGTSVVTSAQSQVVFVLLFGFHQVRVVREMVSDIEASKE